MFRTACIICTVTLAAQAIAAQEKPGPATPDPTGAIVRQVAPITLQRFDDVTPEKYPWGWIRWLMNSKIDPQAEMTVGIVHIEPQQSNPLHIHPNSAEYLHVLSGSCEHRLGDKWVTVKAGDTLRIPRNVPHMARTGKEPCRVMVIYDTGQRQMVPVDDKPSERP